MWIGAKFDQVFQQVKHKPGSYAKPPLESQNSIVMVEYSLRLGKMSPRQSTGPMENFMVNPIMNSFRANNLKPLPFSSPCATLFVDGIGGNFGVCGIGIRGKSWVICGKLS